MGMAGASLSQMEQAPLFNSINLALGIEYPDNQTSRLTTMCELLLSQRRLAAGYFHGS